MPGTVYEDQSFSPYWVGQEGDVYVRCSFQYGTTFAEGTIFDACQLLGNTCEDCQPYIITGFGNVFGNQFGPCSFYYVQFGMENVLHMGWIDLGSNIRSTNGNYGENIMGCNVDGGVVRRTQNDCATGDTAGAETMKACFNTKRNDENKVKQGDRLTGLLTGGGDAASDG